MATVEWQRCLRCGPNSQLIPFGICVYHAQVAQREERNPEDKPDNGDVGLMQMGGNLPLKRDRNG